jgi:Peptidase inhibitor I78 family
MKTPARMLVPGLALALAACAQLGANSPDAVAQGRTCGADGRQDWVGQSVASLNDIDLPEGTRVLFPTTPATMDFNAERLNVAVDAADNISRVYCG